MKALPAGAAPEVDGARVTYRRPGLTEWYENAKSGLEQGFLVAGRPAGCGPLCLVGNLGAALRAELRNGVLDLFDPHQVHVLRYGALRVTDARGKEIPSRLLGSASGLNTSPSWTAEGDQVGAQFGFSVAGAGDVDSDGYSDVIVGAAHYSNVDPDEGRAYVYLGSAAAAGPSLTPDWMDIGHFQADLFGSSVACAGDVNGDGHSDVIVSAPNFSNGQVAEGMANLYYGNGGDGLERLPRQSRLDDSAPIALLGASSNGAFHLKLLGRTPAGRGRVRLQYEVKPLGSAFDGTGLVTGPAIDTGAPAAGGSRVDLGPLVSGLAPSTCYRWRARVLTDSPTAPRSLWLYLPGNAITETDLRTGSLVAVEPTPAESPALRLDLAGANPFRNAAELRYALPARGVVRLAIYDVSGRQVAVLAEGEQEGGPHTVRWGARGRSGVYLARLDFGGESRSQKIIRTH